MLFISGRPLLALLLSRDLHLSTRFQVDRLYGEKIGKKLDRYSIKIVHSQYNLGGELIPPTTRRCVGGNSETAW